jgi:hypothetical protein
MKSILGGAMCVLRVSVALIAIATPYRYGAWLDPSATVVIAGFTLNYGTAFQSVLLHIAKAIFVAAIVPAWRRSRLAGAICALVCILLVALSLWNAVALLALQRSERVAEARAAIEQADSRRTELETIGARLALVGWKPLATVEAEIAAERHQWMWDATSGCTAAASRSQRQFCARHVRLEGERATAREAEHLRSREAEFRREITRQPDLIMLVAWLGISLDTAELLRTLFWAAVVEIVEIAAFWFMGFFRPATGARERAAKAEHEPPSATPAADKVPPSPGKYMRRRRGAGGRRSPIARMPIRARIMVPAHRLIGAQRRGTSTRSAKPSTCSSQRCLVAPIFALSAVTSSMRTSGCVNSMAGLGSRAMFSDSS